jgi:hypothetical protein
MIRLSLKTKSRRRKLPQPLTAPAATGMSSLTLYNAEATIPSSPASEMIRGGKGRGEVDAV